MKRRDTQTYMEGKGHVKMEAEIGVTGVQGKEEQGAPGASRTLQKLHSGRPSPWSLLKEVAYSWILHLWLLNCEGMHFCRGQAEGTSFFTPELCRKGVTEQAAGSPWKGLLTRQPMAGIWEAGFQEGSQHSLVARRGSPGLSCWCTQWGFC